MICRNREANDRGFSHGGVAVIFRDTAASLKPIKLHNPDKIEVLLVSGAIHGIQRKVVVVACYIPPNYSHARGRTAQEFIAGAVAEAKRRFDDPIIIIAGDFNQWKVQEHLADFPDISEHDVGPTRGQHSIDRIFFKPSRVGDQNCSSAGN